jgi:hypothetical protein
MFQCTSRLRCVVIACALITGGTYWPTQALAQAEIKKAWPKRGAWQAQLVQPANGGYICMLNAIGSDPHPFGVSFIETPDHLAFMVDDRTEGLRYLPTMTVSVDGKEIATYPTFNDPPMTSTSPDDGAKVRSLIARLAAGEMLKVDARRMTYTLTLEGFPQAVQQFVACRQEMAQLQGGTIGQGK